MRLTFEPLNITCIVLSSPHRAPASFSIVPNEERAYAAAGGRPREGRFYSESFIVQPLLELKISPPLWWHHHRCFFTGLCDNIPRICFVSPVDHFVTIFLLAQRPSHSSHVDTRPQTWLTACLNYHTTVHLWRVTNVFCDVTVAVNFDHQNLIRWSLSSTGPLCQIWRNSLKCSNADADVLFWRKQTMNVRVFSACCLIYWFIFLQEQMILIIFITDSISCSFFRRFMKWKRSTCRLNLLVLSDKEEYSAISDIKLTCMQTLCGLSPQ